MSTQAEPARLQTRLQRSASAMGRLAAARPPRLLAPAAVAAACVGLWTLMAFLMPHPTTIVNPQGSGGGYPDGTVLQPLLRWDAYWYGSIAEHGYQHGAGRYQAYAFFPLLPGLTALVRGALPFLSIGASGLLINATAMIAGAVLIDRGLADWPTGRRLTAVAVLLTLPSAFFYATLYSEALLFLSVALTMWGLRDERRYLWTALGVLLATLDRPPGVLVLILVIALSSARAHRRMVVAAGLAAALGMGAVLITDMIAVGDPLAFVHAQSGWSSLRTLGITDGLRWLVTQSQPAAIGHSVIPVGYWELYLAAIVTWLCRRRLGPALPYIVASLLLFLLAGGLGTQSRYLVTLLPLWIALLGLVVRSRPAVWILTTSLAISGGVAINLWMLSNFVKGAWAG